MAFAVRALVAGLMVGACAAAQSPDAATGEPEIPGSPPARAAAPARVAAQPWTPFKQVQAWPPSGEAFVSRGHAGGRFMARVIVSPTARAAYEQLVRSTILPPGAIVVEQLRQPDGRPVAWYAMQKAATGVWRFAAVTPRGDLDDTIDPTLCARCHAEAPADGLFGLPRR